MAVSGIGGTGDVTAYLDQIRENQSSSEKAQSVSDSLTGLSSTSSREDLEKAAKTFESYFVEQIIKEQKKINDALSSEEKDSTISRYTDLYMDSTIQDLSDTIVDQYGGTFTDTMVDQMMANYGIKDSGEKTSQKTSAAGTSAQTSGNAASAADSIASGAQANVATSAVPSSAEPRSADEENDSPVIKAVQGIGNINGTTVE